MELFHPFDQSFLAQYRQYLRNLARARLGRGLWAKIDPSDVVQEALLKAHRAFEQFRGTTERELAAWLKAILNNTLANAVRSCVNRGDAVSLPAADGWDSSAQMPVMLPVDGRLPPDEVACRNEQLLHLARALARLPHDQRCVLELKHLHGLTVTEISERTGHSRPSVVGLLYRGMRGLRALMDETDSGARQGRPLGD
jgi:RNA polymerase sigma-70 factor (ECF subfamily)